MQIDLEKEWKKLDEKTSLTEIQEYAKKMIIARGFEEGRSVLLIATTVFA